MKRGRKGKKEVPNPTKLFSFSILCTDKKCRNKMGRELLS